MDNRYYIGFAVPPVLGADIRSAYPPDEQRDSLANGIVTDWTPDDALHCTLMFVGPVENIAGLTEQMRCLSTGLDSVRLALDGPTVLLNGHLVIPVVGADHVAQVFIQGLGHLSEDRGLRSRPYFGHVTIARTTDPAAAAHLTSRVIQYRWEVDRVYLVRSNGRSANPRYSVAAWVPLGLSARAEG